MRVRGELQALDADGLLHNTTETRAVYGTQDTRVQES